MKNGDEKRANPRTINKLDDNFNIQTNRIKTGHKLKTVSDQEVLGMALMSITSISQKSQVNH